MKILQRVLLVFGLIVLLCVPKNAMAYDFGYGINANGLDESGRLILALNQTGSVSFDTNPEWGYRFKECKAANGYAATVTTEGNTCYVTTDLPGRFAVEVILEYNESDTTSASFAVYAGKEYIDEQINKIYFSNRDLSYGEFVMLRNKTVSLPRFVYSNGGCEFNVETATYNCSGYYNLQDYWGETPYSFGGNITGVIKYEQEIHAGSNNRSYGFFSEFDKKKTLFLFEDESVAYYEDNYLVTGNAGETNLYIINRETLEIIIYNIKVVDYTYEPNYASYMTSDEVTQKLNELPEVLNINIQNTSQKGSYINNWSYQYIAKEALFEYIFNTEYNDSIGYSDFYSYDVICNESGTCQASFQYRDDKSSGEGMFYTTDVFTINLEGINVYGTSSSVGNAYKLDDIVSIYDLPIYPEDVPDVTFEYDEEYISYDEETKEMVFLKAGVTEITVSIGEYTGSNKIIIGISYGDYLNLLELNNLNNTITLDYSPEDFENNLDLLAELVYEKYRSIVPNDILDLTDYNVMCLSTSMCVVAFEDEKGCLQGMSAFAKKIVYNKTNEDFKNIDEITNSLKDVYLISFEDYIRLNNSAKGNKDAYYQNLLNLLDINKYLTNSNYEVQYSNVVESHLFENVYGNYDVTLDLFYNNKRIFSKDIRFIALPYIDIPLEEPHTHAGRSRYAENALKEILPDSAISCSIEGNIINATINDEYVLKFAFVQDDYVKPEMVESIYSSYEAEVGQTIELELRYYPDTVNVFPEIEYTSSDESVATVTADGVIEIVGEGFTVIRYTADNRFYGQILVLVGMTRQEFINYAASDVENNVVISYGDLRVAENQAFEYSLNYKTINDKLDGLYLYTTVEKEGDNYYYYKTYTDYRPVNTEYTSEKRIINYTLKGIYIEKENYSVNSGTSIKVDISYTEGNNKKLFYRTEKPGIVYFNPETGMLTGLNSGVTRINVYDEKGNYFNYFYAYTNEDTYMQELITSIKQNGVKLDINQAKYGAQNAFEWVFREAIGYIADEVYFTCDDESKTCDTTFIANEKEYNLVVPYKIVGVTIHNQPDYSQGYGDFDLAIGETLQIDADNYAQSSDKNLYYESSNEQACSVDNNGLVTALNPGVCQIKVKNADGDSSTISVVVARDALQAANDSVFELLPNEINVKMKKYSELTDPGNEAETYIIILNRELQKYVNDTSYYFTFSLNDLIEYDDGILTVEYTRHYLSSDGYFITSIGSKSSKRVKVNFLENAPQGDEHASEIIGSFKKEYDLSMMEALRYQFDQRDNKSIWDYCGELWGTIANRPGYSFIFDNRMGSGDNGYTATEGGFIILLYEDAPIYVTEAAVTVTFVAPSDAPKTQEEFIRYLTQLIIDAYQEIHTPAFTYNTSKSLNMRDTLYTANNVPDVTVEYKESTGMNELYWITVNNTNEFGLEVVRTEGAEVEEEETVQSITLNKDSLTMNINDVYQLTYTINPTSLSNKTVNWTSSNPSVVSVNNGKLTALKEGSAIITASVDGKVDEVTVNVKGVTLSQILYQIGYKIKETFVKGFSVSEKISDIQTRMGNKVTINSPKDIVTTGTVITYNGQTYTVVINGDISGDGLINSADLLAMRKHLLGTAPLTGAYKDAAAIANGQTINSLDLLRLRQFLLGEFIIKQ